MSLPAALFGWLRAPSRERRYALGVAFVITPVVTLLFPLAPWMAAVFPGVRLPTPSGAWMTMAALHALSVFVGALFGARLAFRMTSSYQRGRFRAACLWLFTATWSLLFSALALIPWHGVLVLLFLGAGSFLFFVGSALCVWMLPRALDIHAGGVPHGGIVSRQTMRASHQAMLGISVLTAVGSVANTVLLWGIFLAWPHFWKHYPS